MLQHNSQWDNELKFDDLRLVKELKRRKSKFLANLAEIYNSSQKVLNTRIPKVFENYTLHDIGHSNRIMEYMFELIKDVKKLSDIDIALLICSATLHDIGMAVSKADIKSIKEDKLYFEDIYYSAMLSHLGGDENAALQEYVRKYHAELSAKYIEKKLANLLKVPGDETLSYKDDLKLICTAHTKDFDYIKLNLKETEYGGDYIYNPQYCASLLRLGDILDIDRRRTPPRLYELIEPTGISRDEWKQHFILRNNKKINSAKGKQKKVEFHGKCWDAKIHRKFLKYVDWVNYEIRNASLLTQDFEVQYLFDLEHEVLLDIETVGYETPDLKMSVDFKAISSLLMGEQIYGDAKMGLRELIQNSMDACKVRKEIEDKKGGITTSIYRPEIHLIIDEASNNFIVKDNGVGMSRNIIKNNFLSIGRSYYRTDEYKLKNLSYKPIGNFGIGFLACFMLSKEVIVKTRSLKNATCYTLELEKDEEFVVITSKDDLEFQGTEVSLRLDEIKKAFDIDDTLTNEHFIVLVKNFV